MNFICYGFSCSIVSFRIVRSFVSCSSFFYSFLQSSAINIDLTIETHTHTQNKYKNQASHNTLCVLSIAYLAIASNLVFSFLHLTIVLRIVKHLLLDLIALLQCSFKWCLRCTFISVLVSIVVPFSMLFSSDIGTANSFVWYNFLFRYLFHFYIFFLLHHILLYYLTLKRSLHHNRSFFMIQSRLIFVHQNGHELSLFQLRLDYSIFKCYLLHSFSTYESFGQI